MVMSGTASLSVTKLRSAADDLGVHRFVARPFRGDDVVDAVIEALSE
jgi:hypothetical protein